MSDSAELDDLSPAAKQVYDALDCADNTLTKAALADEIDHTERTVKGALAELRAQDCIEAWDWPRRYRLAPASPDTDAPE